MTTQKLSDLLLLSIELEQTKRKLERDLERVKKRRDAIRVILTKYQQVETEMLFI